MKFRIVAVGRVREGYIAAGLDDFRKRLRRYVTLEEVEIEASHGGDPDRAVVEEGERILKTVASEETVWLLERSGTPLDSIELANRVAKNAAAGVRQMTFVVAGAYGASAAVQSRAAVLWSLSKLTFLHEWTRLIVIEQLYRAMKITRNEPYHK